MHVIARILGVMKIGLASKEISTHANTLKLSISVSENCFCLMTYMSVRTYSNFAAECTEQLCIAKPQAEVRSVVWQKSCSEEIKSNFVTGITK